MLGVLNRVQWHGILEMDGIVSVVLDEKNSLVETRFHDWYVSGGDVEN